MHTLKRTHILIIAALLLTICFCPAVNVINAAMVDETIRVAIAKSETSVTISGDGLLVTDDAGIPLQVDLPSTVRLDRDGLQVEGKKYKRLLFSAPSVLMVNSKPYRGLAELSVLDKKILVVNQLPLDDYLVGLINCEISSAWPIEAVKAQAIIARTYAVNRKMQRLDAPYHLESSVLDQVYEGSLVEDSRARRAVSETAGDVLTYDGKIIQAFYHSSCGGQTESSENVWGGTQPYLKGVECQYCFKSPTATAWEYRLAAADIEEKLRVAGYKVPGLYEVRPGEINSRGRLKQVQLKGLKNSMAVTGEQFRKAIGYGLIKSTRFSTKNVRNEIIFSGTGNGHGVGLCQWGAKQRAVDGFESNEILAYYYPGTELRKLYEIH